MPITLAFHELCTQLRRCGAHTLLPTTTHGTNGPNIRPGATGVNSVTIVSRKSAAHDPQTHKAISYGTPGCTMCSDFFERSPGTTSSFCCEKATRERSVSARSCFLMTCGFMWAVLGYTLAHEARPTDSSCHLIPLGWGLCVTTKGAACPVPRSQSEPPGFTSCSRA
jgi:hypothetical protein